MRRLLTAVLAASAALLVVPASAAPDAGTAEPDTADSRLYGRWVPAPSEPWDRAAGVICDFAIHGEPIVDEVVRMTIETFPDGSPKRELFDGDLVIRVTNTETGASTDVDASGHALFEYGEDGSMTWYARGPVLVGSRGTATGGNLPRGMWRIDGVYVIEFAPTTLDKTVTMIHGTQHDVCTDLA